MTDAAAGILITMHRMSQGGADRVAVLLANGFLAAGIPVDFLLLRSSGEAETLLTQMLAPGVRLHVAGPPMGSRHLELVRGVGAIRALARKVRPGLVLASSSNMGLVTGVACRPLRRVGIAVAMKLTNPVIRPRDRYRAQKMYRRRLYRSIFEQHDRVLTLTNAENRHLQCEYPTLAARFESVPNPYVPDGLLQNELSARPTTGPPQLVTLARMMPQKRLDLLLHAFSKVRRRDARLLILGDGPLRPRLEALSNALGIADRVDMPGFVHDVIPALRSSGLFVLSSDYEGLPAAVIEALACNLPVVTTDCFFGARDLLDPSPFCALAPVGDAEALAAAIDQVIAMGPPSGLREIASDYGVQASIQAHVSALRPLITA